MISTQDSPVGKPAVKYVTKADYSNRLASILSIFSMASLTLPSFLHCANVCFNPSIFNRQLRIGYRGKCASSEKVTQYMSSMMILNKSGYGLDICIVVWCCYPELFVTLQHLV